MAYDILVFMKSQIYDGLYSAEIRDREIGVIKLAADAVVSDKAKAAENMAPVDKAGAAKKIQAIGSVIALVVESKPRLTDLDRVAIGHGYPVEPEHYVVLPLGHAAVLEEVLSVYSDKTVDDLITDPGSSAARAVDGYIAGEMADQLTDLLAQSQPEA
jgi:hypothetical protein